MKGKEKLKSLGVELPLFPLTSVGSFPKPDYVKEARKNFPAGHIKRKAAEDRATRYWLKVQEEFGYDVLVHGEMERGDMVAYFGEELGGFQNGDPEEPVRSYGNRFWIPPEITGKVFWRAPMTVKSWQFAQSLTSLPMKGMLTGPATIYDWSLDGFYGSRREAVADIALSLRREIEALIVAGAKIIQIDEPSLAHVWKDFPTLKKAFHLMLDGLQESAYFIMHTCYGEDVFEKIYPEMLTLPVDNLDIELANSNMDLLKVIAEFPATKDLSVGVVDVHTHEIESVDLVRDRIRRSLEVIPKDKLWLGPDCGLKTRTVAEAIGKLKVIAEARKLVFR